MRIRAAVAKSIAQKFGLPFVELQKVFENAEKEYGNSYVLEDGVHPTTYGHMLIAKEWIKCFEANK